MHILKDEEYFRFEKQNFDFEKFRVISLKKVKNEDNILIQDFFTIVTVKIVFKNRVTLLCNRS